MPGTTVTETALQALLAALEGIAGATVRRNADRPERVPAGGLIVLRDGAAGVVEESFSPLRYHVQWTAAVEVYAATVAAREVLLRATVAAVAADRSLGGAVEWAQEQPAERATDALEGADLPPGAQLPVLLMFTAAAGEAV